jgi:hypothetical protein
MALESATYISQLVKTNPVDSDAVGQGDDHLRMIKDVLKTNFSGLNGSGTTAVTTSAAELNLLAGVSTLAPEGTAVLSTGETGATKFLREDGDNSSSWQVPTDTNTTYTAGDGLDLSGTTFSTDLKSNGGLEISTTELSVAQGISQYDVAQFAASVVDDDFLRISTTSVEGRSASEVLTDIAASPVAGSSSIVTVGTVTAGVWNGTDVAVADGGTGSGTASGARTNLGVAIGSDVQAYDADTAKLDTDQAWTGSQRATAVTDNDGSYDMDAGQNFITTPAAAVTITFTNIANGQSGFVKLINSGGETISLHANSKGDANLATTVTTAGTYLLSYFGDGTDVWLTNSAIYA